MQHKRATPGRVGAGCDRGRVCLCCAALVRGYLASTGLEEDGSAGGAVWVI